MSVPRPNPNNGDRFGRLVVIDRLPDYVTLTGKKYPRFLCQCDCGKTKSVDKINLLSGKTLSCGCLQKERTSKASKKHGDTDSRLYNVWCAMKRRCYNKSVPEYVNYGARGVTMCDEWRDDYTAFMQWAISNGYQGDAKRGVCTIDRIDNNKGYFPDNCRWVTMREQCNNERRNHLFEYHGETRTVSEWAELFHLSYEKLYQRLVRYHWDIQRALTTA